MKTVVIIALIVAGVCAEVPPFQCTSSSAFVCKFQEIGHNIKHHAINLGGKLADIGMNILDATISQGTDILVQGTKAVVGTLHDHMQGVGKRELAAISSIQNVAAQGKQILQTIGQGLKDNLKATITKIVGVVNDANSLNINPNFADIINNVVGAFKDKASGALAQVKQGLSTLVNNVLGKISGTKRGISDLLKGAASVLQNAVKGVSDALSPAVSTVVSQVTALGNAAKDHASNIIANLQQSVADLSAKLAAHAGQVVDKGKAAVQQSIDALNQIKDAVGAIASGAVDKVKDTIGGVINAGKDAINTVKDHVVG